MQIDFHHGVIYVIARLAGFKKEDAEVIAYCSQYVDDDLSDEPIMFATGEIYKPLCSAHKALDYRNFDALANSLVWTPFHFLPGNCMLPAGEGREKDFHLRIVCQANSPLAQDMVKECIRNNKKENALHRLGITLHTYADTWAHQGFSGIQSNVNRVQYLEDVVSKALLQKALGYFGDLIDMKGSSFLSDVCPLGHGPVLSYPDRPYLKWQYINYEGKLINRDNTAVYTDAVINIYEVMKRFLEGDLEAKVSSINEKDLLIITDFLRDFSDEDGEERHTKWLEAIRYGEFSFGPDEVDYKVEEYARWDKTTSRIGYVEYRDEFISSGWRKFQDALNDHHYFIRRVIYPNYELCLA